jgi:AsmA family protein
VFSSMNDQPSTRPRPKRWKWILGIAAILVLSTTLAALAILSSIDVNTLKPFLTQAIKQETGRDLEIRGAIDLRLGFRPSLVVDDILFQNAPWASRSEMAKIKRLEAKIMVLPLLNGDIRVTRLVLLEPDLLLETDTAGKWNFEFDKPEASFKGDGSPHGFTLPRMAFHQVEIEKGKVSYRDGATGLLYCVAIDRFTAHSEGIDSPVVLAFNGSYRGKPLELSGTVGSLVLLKEPGKGYPVDLTAKGAGSQFKVEGTVQDILNLKGLTLKADAQVRSTSQIATFLGGTLAGEFGPLQINTAISDVGDETYQLSDLRISSIAGEAAGNLTVRLGGSRPKFSGVLATQRLNLNPFFNGRKKTQAKPEKAEKIGRVFPNDPLALDILRSVDVELKLNAGQVQFRQLPLTNLSMEVTVNEGRLILSAITGKVAGGEANGRVEMHAQGSVATAKAVFKASQMDLQTLSAELKVEGKLDVDLDLLSRGSSIAGLMASLNGRTVAVMGQGRLHNKNIQILGGDLASGGYKLLNPSSQDANYTDINCAVSGFDITDGMAQVTALVMDTPDMTVIGEGQVNLRDETLDLALKTYQKGGAGGLHLSLAELAKSFKLVGTLAAPSLQMDPAQTMFAAMKAAGGVLLFGPAGILAAFAGESRDGGNPCLAAVESAKKGVRGSESEGGETQKGTEDKGIAGALKGVGESVKKLFGSAGTQPQPDTRPDPYRGGP